MEIEAIETTRRNVTVDISVNRMYSAMKKHVYDKMGIPFCYDPFIKDGRIWMFDSYRQENVVIVASPTSAPTSDQIDVIEAFNTIYRYM